MRWAMNRLFSRDEGWRPSMPRKSKLTADDKEHAASPTYIGRPLASLYWQPCSARWIPMLRDQTSSTAAKKLGLTLTAAECTVEIDPNRREAGGLDTC